MKKVLDRLPDDAESHFMLGVAQGQRGELDEAEESILRAIQLGTPPGRLPAGPRQVLAPLRRTPTFARIASELEATPIHGPMLGAVTDRAARVWVRTAHEADVHVLLQVADADDPPRVFGPVRSVADADFTAVVPIDGLQPASEYTYRITINGGEPVGPWPLRTFPEAGEPVKLKLAFGGGAGWVPEHERMWDTIAALQPHALLLLGDNVYSDDPETPDVQLYCYYRRHSRPEWRRLVSQTPVFAIWDDHDFSTDDSWGGPLVEVPAWKRPVWNVFQQNWNNPSYGGGEEHPGCWFDFMIGDVHFIMLDGRYYRTDAGRFGGPGVESPSMLGSVQKTWLLETLGKSAGTFKVLVSPVPWDFRAKAGQAGLDTWRGYAEEREEIFSHIERERIEGVVLMSADRHRSDAWRIERPGGYDLYEFNSSRLTNQHLHETMEEAIFSYNARQSFGLVSFDTQAEDPSVTYDVVNIDGEKVHSLTIPKSRLRFDR